MHFYLRAGYTCFRVKEVVGYTIILAYFCWHLWYSATQSAARCHAFDRSQCRGQDEFNTNTKYSIERPYVSPSFDPGPKLAEGSPQSS